MNKTAYLTRIRLVDFILLAKYNFVQDPLSLMVPNTEPILICAC